MNMKVENEMALPITKSVTVMLLEPYAGKLARTVLRGRKPVTASSYPLLPRGLPTNSSEDPFFLRF